MSVVVSLFQMLTVLNKGQEKEKRYAELHSLNVGRNSQRFPEYAVFWKYSCLPDVSLFGNLSIIVAV